MHAWFPSKLISEKLDKQMRVYYVFHLHMFFFYYYYQDIQIESKALYLFQLLLAGLTFSSYFYSVCKKKKKDSNYVSVKTHLHYGFKHILLSREFSLWTNT